MATSTSTAGATKLALPELPLDAWQSTYETVHMYTQVVGKLRLELSPRQNHWWHVALYVGARGFTTSPIPAADVNFQCDFDFLDRHELAVTSSHGERFTVPLGIPVKDFYRNLMTGLGDMGVRVTINPRPQEVANPIPCDVDTRSDYDRERVRDFWQVMSFLHATFCEFRSGFAGKSSPVHFFWGAFDLATTRFSGRSAAQRPGDFVSAEAYNAELSSLGFWPGGDWPGAGRIDQPLLYSYAYPEPGKFPEQPASPRAAHYAATMGEFILPWEDVRTADDPRKAVLDFAQSTFEAAASLQNWPVDRLTLRAPPGS